MAETTDDFPPFFAAIDAADEQINDLEKELADLKAQLVDARAERDEALARPSGVPVDTVRRFLDAVNAFARADRAMAQEAWRALCAARKEVEAEMPGCDR